MEKQNLSESTMNLSSPKEQSLTTSQEVVDSRSQTPNKVHTTILKLDKCNHSFKRVRPNQVECIKCGYGLFDTPDKPFVLTR
jgi:hypothetical protein